MSHAGPGNATDRAKALAQQAASAKAGIPLAGIPPATNTKAVTPQAVCPHDAAGLGEGSALQRPAVVLVGPPGSGKTSVGAAIARLTGLSLRDVDADVEKQAGKSISEIFIEDGEPHFRGLERHAVQAGLKEHSGVLSLGGGAILAAETRTALAGHAVVFLTLSMATGVRRTGLASNRPLLAGLNPRATYKALMEARMPLYREVSRYEFGTDHLSVTEVARMIIEKLELQ